MILPIYTYGQPVLREKAQPADEREPGLKQLIDDMFETMYSADGIGLAAPQVGRSIRLLVIDADPLSKDYPECRLFRRVMVNPEITEKSSETVALEEGCLSFPGIHEKVARAVSVRVRYRDENGARKEETFEGFAARVVQHEYEHLDGAVFIDSISPIRKQLNRSKLNAIIKGAAKCTYRVKPVKKQ
ncbi:MAG: peptide deformylase [Tannerella sp.]|jgi:peptide deformylase|nr:peptide deformylase [Tannerella sp.]